MARDCNVVWVRVAMFIVQLTVRYCVVRLLNQWFVTRVNCLNDFVTKRSSSLIERFTNFRIKIDLIEYVAWFRRYYRDIDNSQEQCFGSSYDRIQSFYKNWETPSSKISASYWTYHKTNIERHWQPVKRTRPTFRHAIHDRIRFIYTKLGSN